MPVLWGCIVIKNILFAIAWTVALPFVVLLAPIAIAIAWAADWVNDFRKAYKYVNSRSTRND